MNSPFALLPSIELAPKADLYAVGCGMDDEKQLTAEGIQALACSTSVFGFSDVSYLAPIIKSLGSNFIELDYAPVESREAIFRVAATRIAKATLSSAPITWLTLGSPIRHVWLTKVLRSWAHRENLVFRTMLAPSSLDALLDVLEIDDSVGLQLYDAARLVLFNQQPDPSAHCFIFNPQKANTDRSLVGCSPRAGMFGPLRERLNTIYPGSHPISSIVLSSTAGPSITTMTISSLTEAKYEALGTLWIPPLTRQVCTGQNVSWLHTLHNLVRVASTPCDPMLGAAAKLLVASIRNNIS